MRWLRQARAIVPLLFVLPAAALSQAVSPVPQGSPIPRILPRQAPELAPRAGDPAPQPGGEVPDVAVRVGDVRIEGASAYPPAELERLVAGLTGAAVPLARIEEARLAVLNRYRGDGYVLTAVSAEVDAAGRLRFVVAEGRIAEVLLDGDIGPAATQVLLFLQRLVTPGPLDQALLERQLLLAQEVPGVTIRTVLRPVPGGDPGALQLIAQVSRAASTLLFAADNRAYEFAGPQQAVAVLSLNSFTQYGERTDLILFSSFDDTQVFGQVGVEAFIGSSGLRFRLQAGQGRSRPSGTLRDIGYEGETRLLSGGVIYPLVRRRSQLVTIYGGLEAIENEIRIAAPGGGDTRASFDSLRVLRAGGDWAAQDILLGADLAALNSASFRVSQGLTGLGASGNDAPLPGRVGQVVDFFKVSGEFSRNQSLFSPWDGAMVGIFGLIAGQWTNDVLPPIEKFYLGGLRLNRGYYAGEVTGDSALSTSVELRLDDAYRVNAWGVAADVAAQYYLFYDWGQSFENQPEQPNRRLSSMGAGVRLLVDRRTEVQFEGVRRFTRYPQGERPGLEALSENAAYWRLVTRF
jgi:hemolysin activation/secretion protein